MSALEVAPEEQAVIGCLLTDPRLIDDASGLLSASDFYDPKLQVAFSAIVSSWQQDGQRPDVITIAGTPGVEMSVSDLNAITNTVPSLSSLSTYAERVRQAARRRRLSYTLAAMSQRARDGADLDEIQAEMTGLIDGDSCGSSRLRALREQVLDLDRLAAVPPPEPLVDEWLMLDTISVLYGPSGVGKSFVALDLAAHVASERAWWHANGVDNGSVLYVAAEGLAGMSRRVSAWEAHHRDRPANLQFLPRAVNLFEQADAQALAQLAAEISPKLIVVDTLARSMLGGDENTTRDMSVVVENLDRVRRSSGACVLAVHHSGKDASNGARGSSALRAAADTELELTGDDVSQMLRCKKQKDGREPAPLTFKRRFVPGTDSCVIETGTADDTAMATATADTLNALSEVQVGDGVSTATWRVAVAASERTFYRHRKWLLDEGFVTNNGSTNRPLYQVVPGR